MRSVQLFLTLHPIILKMSFPFIIPCLSNEQHVFSHGQNLKKWHEIKFQMMALKQKLFVYLSVKLQYST